MTFSHSASSFVSVEGNLIEEDCFITEKVIEIDSDKFERELFHIFKDSSNIQ